MTNCGTPTSVDKVTVGGNQQTENTDYTVIKDASGVVYVHFLSGRVPGNGVAVKVEGKRDEEGNGINGGLRWS